MTHKSSKTVIASAVSLALAGMMLATSSNAAVVVGRIDNSNNLSGKLGACGLDGTPTACVDAWNLDNVVVKLLRALDGSEFGSFDPVTGSYTTMNFGDSFASFILNTSGTDMARVTGKVWPVGEPTGIKAVVDDMKTKEGKPNNCLINTSYLEGAYLDTPAPMPVICSSDFQTHKRFKIAMLPATVEGVANGAEGNGIDVVFNVTDEGTATVRPYQVFSKINNYTGKRLKGYKIVVGTDTGANFKSADELNIESQLYISLGKGEGWSEGSATSIPPSAPDGSDLFDDDGGLASFSHGLFGAPDKHFKVNGFFDSRTAGFNVDQDCSKTPGCTGLTAPYAPYPATIIKYSDTIYSTLPPLPSNYNGPPTPPLTAPLFGDWLPSIWMPKGIFWDFDNNSTTDADLVAWWDGATWRKNYDSGFAVVSDAELNAWASDKQCGTADALRSCYAIDDIEDVLNLGINYIVNVGDGIPGGKITIRIIPVVADTQDPPGHMATSAPPLPPPTTPTETTPTPSVPVVTSSDGGGGGCTIGNDGRFDPTLPAMLFAGLGFLGWRRYKAGK